MWFFGCAFADTPALEALDAVVRDGLLVMISSDGTSLEALALETGERRWTTALGPPAQAALLHDLAPGVLLAQTATQFTAVRADTGAVLSVRAARGEWEFVWRGMGGCALRSDCALAPISCEDGGALGEPLRGHSVWMHTLGMDGEGYDASSRCTGELEVIGAAGGLSLYLVEEQDGPRVVARDAQGRELWRQPSGACRHCAAMGRGMAPDASLCWTADQLDSAELVVRGFSCSTGALRFERTLAVQKTAYEGLITGWVPSPPSLLVASHGQVRALTPAGETRWERAVPPDTLLVPEGLRVPSFPLPLSPFRALERVDPATGKPLERVPVPASQELRVADDGSIGLFLQGATHGRSGRLIPAPERFSFVRDPAGSRVFVGKRVVLQLPGDGWVLGEHRGPHGTWLVVAEARQGRPDLVHRLSLP